MTKSKYSFRQTFLKGIKYLVFYAVPYGIFAWLKFYPNYASLTIGTVLTWVANWFKNKDK